MKLLRNCNSDRTFRNTTPSFLFWSWTGSIWLVNVSSFLQHLHHFG